MTKVNGGLFWIPGDVVKSMKSIQEKKNLKPSEALRYLVFDKDPLEIRTKNLFEKIENGKKG